ncbi:MAG: carboxymuconolactone decarboxylase family protein [Cyanobacteria bacterium J06642_2]
MDSDREYHWYEIRQAYGAAIVQALRQLETADPDLASDLTQALSKDSGSGPALDAKSQELVAIATLMASSERRSQLKARLHGALNVGCSKREILETIVEVALCTNFDLAARGLRIAREVFRERSYDSP